MSQTGSEWGTSMCACEHCQHRLLAVPKVGLAALVAGWAGLVVSALNCVPLGELDGGRIVHGIWGRRAATRVGAVATLLMGIGALFDDLALYWILFVLLVQRGPVLPQNDEVSDPDDSSTVALAAGLLFVPVLALLPYIGDVTQASGF
jgi:membrane-associated protease RseP (regulator of RpoE activity)